MKSGPMRDFGKVWSKCLPCEVTTGRFGYLKYVQRKSPPQILCRRCKLEIKLQSTRGASRSAYRGRYRLRFGYRKLPHQIQSDQKFIYTT
jgi:hypothetical protein